MDGCLPCPPVLQIINLKEHKNWAESYEKIQVWQAEASQCFKINLAAVAVQTTNRQEDKQNEFRTTNSTKEHHIVSVAYITSANVLMLWNRKLQCHIKGTSVKISLTGVQCVPGCTERNVHIPIWWVCQSALSFKIPFLETNHDLYLVTGKNNIRFVGKEHHLILTQHGLNSQHAPSAYKLNDWQCNMNVHFGKRQSNQNWERIFSHFLLQLYILRLSVSKTLLLLFNILACCLFMPAVLFSHNIF